MLILLNTDQGTVKLTDEEAEAAAAAIMLGK